MSIQHLTDEQFANLLAGDHTDTAARIHVESCAACRQELTSLGAVVGDLSYASLRWAEQRASRIHIPSRWVLNWNAMPGWGATLAGVLLFGFAIGAHMQLNQQGAVVAQQTQTISAPSDDELAQDNNLMLSIDSELSEQVGPQVPASDLDTSSRTAHHHLLREVSN